MPTIKQPRNPKPSDDVKGPNFPGSIDPGFDNPYRNPSGDVSGPGDHAGRKPVPADPWPWR